MDIIKSGSGGGQRDGLHRRQRSHATAGNVYIGSEAAGGTKDQRQPGDRPLAPQTDIRCRERGVFLQAGQDLRIGGRQSNAQYQYTIQSDNLSGPGEMGADSSAADEKACRVSPMSTATSRTAVCRPRSCMTARPHHAWGSRHRQLTTLCIRRFGQSLVSTMYTPLNQYYVVMEVAPQFWQSPRWT